MPVLLLARGDDAGKGLLRDAIEARYGFSPPPIEALRLTLKGRARVRLGPLMTWLPAEAAGHLRFPTNARWDVKARLLGVPVASARAAVIDHQYYEQGRLTDDSQRAASLRAQLWAIAGLLLTPLSEPYVEVQAIGARQFEAKNITTSDSVILTLNEGDNTLAHVQVRCYNPVARRDQNFKLIIDGLAVVNEVLMPTRIRSAWDDEISAEFSPTAVEINPVFDEDAFVPKSTV